MDSQLILAVSGSEAQIQTDLKARYSGGGDCDTWADQMSYVYTNFYDVKDTNFGALSTRVSTAASSVSTYQGQISNMGSTFDTVLSNL